MTPLFGARHPIIQAPMANVAPPSLAAAVSNAGALGTIAGAMLAPDALRAAIREVRAATEAPFGVNLFAPPFLQTGQLEVVLEELPAVFSFTFGVVDPEPFHAAGIAVLGTATTAEEAAYLEAAGVDGVVAQGAEAPAPAAAVPAAASSRRRPWPALHGRHERKARPRATGRGARCDARRGSRLSREEVVPKLAHSVDGGVSPVTEMSRLLHTVERREMADLRLWTWLLS